MKQSLLPINREYLERIQVMEHRTNYPSESDGKMESKNIKYEITQISVGNGVHNYNSFFYHLFCLYGAEINQTNSCERKHLLSYQRCLNPKSRAYEAKEENEDLAKQLPQAKTKCCW